MPGIDGFELVTRIRELSTVPIIVLSALGDETEREHALRLGADDYLLKTEGVQTLLERVAAVLSKPRPGARSGPSAYKDSALTIHFDRQEVFVHDRKVDLTPKEFKLLSLLVQGSDRVVSVSEDPPARVGLNPLFG
jgi:DNA-binding response OmpR family regulator